MGCPVEQLQLCVLKQAADVLCQIRVEVGVFAAKNHRYRRRHEAQFARCDHGVLAVEGMRNIGGPGADFDQRVGLGGVSEELGQDRDRRDAVRGNTVIWPNRRPVYSSSHKR